MQSGIKRAAVVGSGAMGRGIAQVCAAAGISVVLMDVERSVAESARASIAKALDGDVAKGRLEKAQAERTMAALSVTDTLDGLKDVQLVIEAIVEDLDAKRKLLKDLESAVSGDCILASNTSSLSITALAAACSKPERVAGMHFFNPVPRMKLVEVIQGLKTAPAVIDTLEAVGREIRKEVVRVQDTPGFLVNQVGRGYTLEAVNVVGEGVATFAEVDRVMREAAGFRMGPFELLDLVGLDVNHPATEAIYGQFYQEPRYRPSALMDMRVQARMLGRKTGEGYYRHGDQPETPPAPPAVPDARPASVWVSSMVPQAGQKVRELAAKLGAKVETGSSPSGDALCVVTPIGRDASRSAASEGLDPTRTVAIDTLFGLDTHRTVMTTCVTGETWRAQAHGLFGADGVPVTVIRDSPGFIAQRIVAMIINIGGALAQSRTASASDIDRAVTLGLAYPHGPLGFANALGAAQTGMLLNGLYESYGDPRYRPSPWLARRAALNLNFCDGD